MSSAGIPVLHAISSTAISPLAYLADLSLSANESLARWSLVLFITGL